MQLTTQGLVLREVNYKESDKILTVLTQDMGKLTISARGSRKKGGGISAAAQMVSFPMSWVRTVRILSDSL